MPTYKVTDPSTGRTLRLTGDSPPTEEELNSIFSNIPDVKRVDEGFTSLMSSSKPTPETGDFIIDSLVKTQKEVVGPVVQGLNTALLGIPKAAAKKVFGEDFAKETFPEQSTLRGKALRIGFETAGLIGGGVGKATTAVGRRLIPQGAKIGRRILGSAAQGATAGALTSPEDFMDIGQRSIQALGGSIVGGTLPVLSAGGRLIQRGAKQVGEKIANIKESVARRGVSIQQPDFVRSTLAPEAQKLFQKSFNQFDENFQKFAKNKLRIDDEAVQYISNRTPQVVSESANSLKNTTDSVYQNITSLIKEKVDQAIKLYDNVIANAPETKSINIHNTYKELGNVLRKYGFINSSGKRTPLANEASMQNSIYRKLLDVYESRNNLVGIKALEGKDLTSSQMVKMMRADRETLINKNQFQLIRDNLNQLYREAPSDINLSKVISQLHIDADASGIQGLQIARKAFREARQLEDRFLNSPIIKERKLDKIFKLSGEEMRSLRDLENMLNIKIEVPVKDIVAKQMLEKGLRSQKIEDVVLGENEFFARQLDTAMNSAKYNTVKELMREALGDDKAVDKIFNDLTSFNSILKMKDAIGKTIGVGVAGAAGGGAYSILK